MIVHIFSAPTDYDIGVLFKKELDDIAIGCDAGAFYAVSNGIHLNYCIGDFDSINAKELEIVKNNSDDFLVLPEYKNETDTFKAVEYSLTLKPDVINVYGGIGNRTDHLLANINMMLLCIDKCEINIINNSTHISILSKGQYSIYGNDFDYVSFFAYKDVGGLSIKGFKYELEHYDLLQTDSLCISNEGSGTVNFESGLLLVVKEKEQ